MYKKKKIILGNFAIDIAKYILTAGLIATWFGNGSLQRWYDYILPILVIILMLWAGIVFAGEESNDKKKNIKKK
ncbi:MAG: DUF6722 family protein [Prevotella sp.]|nr:DUF6722 family protein [Prevotella sp.]